MNPQRQESLLALLSPQKIFSPVPIKIPTFLTNQKQNGINKTNTHTYPPTILGKKIKKYILWTIDINHLSA